MTDHEEEYEGRDPLEFIREDGSIGSDFAGADANQDYGSSDWLSTYLKNRRRVTRAGRLMSIAAAALYGAVRLTNKTVWAVGFRSDEPWLWWPLRTFDAYLWLTYSRRNSLNGLIGRLSPVQKIAAGIALGQYANSRFIPRRV